MKFYKNLYVGDTVKKPNKVKRRLKNHAKQLKVYVIMLSQGQDQLEICHCLMLEQPFYKDKANPPYIIGIAGSYDEAVGLVCRIAKEAVSKSGSADLKSYLFSDSDMP